MTCNQLFGDKVSYHFFHLNVAFFVFQSSLSLYPLKDYSVHKIVLKICAVLVTVFKVYGFLAGIQYHTKTQFVFLYVDRDLIP